MAKKPATPHKSRSKNNSKIGNNSVTPAKNKNGIRRKATEIAIDDASSEETEVLVAQSSSTESQNDNVVESSDAEEDSGAEEPSRSDEDVKEQKRTPKSVGKKGKKEESKSEGKKRIKKEEDYEEEAEEKTKTPKKKDKKEEVKNKGKKTRKNEEDEEEAEERSENALYTFPMNRVKSIIKNEIPDLRITSEALFLINRASEKFLQLFCREAYACAFLDRKSYTAYNHLSSVVSKRKRLEFLSDFVPEKVKAKDALAEIADAEK